MPEQGTPTRPLIISLGFGCNNRCAFCSQADLHAAERDRSVIDNLDSAADPSVSAAPAARAVEFVGGEPTLHEALPQWVSHAAGLGFAAVGLQTNGRRLAYRAYTRVLKEAGLDRVDISLQGHRAPLHEYHTQVKESFKQSALGIRNAVDDGLSVAVTTVVSRSNVRHLDDIALLLRSLGVVYWRLRMLAGVGRAAEDLARLMPLWEVVERHATSAVRRFAQEGGRAFIEGVPRCVAPEISRIDSPSVDELQCVFESECADCPAKPSCPGIDPKYRDLYAKLAIKAELKAPAEPGDLSKLPFVGGLGRACPVI